jgi:SAM-dependent methyltransferase
MKPFPPPLPAPVANSADRSGIRFDDAEAYERGMAPWSRLAGAAFLAWLAPPAGLRWLDVGCGTGTFSALIAEQCAPIELQGVDPGEAQLAIARRRGDVQGTFLRGDAMALPFADRRFDAAVMALVVFHLPDPAKGVAELARVARPGGSVAAYAWDVLGGGFPFEPIWQETRAAGSTPQLPRRADAAGIEALRGLWTAAGLEAVETREIVVERTFATFEDYWATSTITAAMRPPLEAMSAEQRAKLKERVRAWLPADSMGRVTWRARANAVKGCVAGSAERGNQQANQRGPVPIVAAN